MAETSSRDRLPNTTTAPAYEARSRNPLAVLRQCSSRLRLPACFCVLGFTTLAGDRARRDTRYNACYDRLQHAGNSSTSSTRVWTSMARRRRARCAARLSCGLGALPSRRSHERVAEAARSSVGAGSDRRLSPPQPSRALAGCGVLFSSSLLCLLRSSASGKHAAAAGKPPRATAIDPPPIAATMHAYDSGRSDESTSCHGVRV